jgi:Domain of unknown function (DUF4326)
VTAPVRIQLKRTKGFRLQTLSKELNGLYAVKVDRSTIYGNRYVIGGWPTVHIDGEIHEIPDAATAVRLHREELEYRIQKSPGAVWELLEPLRGKNLACFCKLGAPCHADTLLELANK